MEEKLNDLGVDALIGADIMYKAGVTEQDLKNPQSFEKMRDVISYMKNIPPDHRSFMMSNVLTGKNVNKLDHLWGYVKLSEQMGAKKKELDMLKEQMGFYEK